VVVKLLSVKTPPTLVAVKESRLLVTGLARPGPEMTKTLVRFAFCVKRVQKGLLVSGLVRIGVFLLELDSEGCRLVLLLGHLVSGF